MDPSRPSASNAKRTRISRRLFVGIALDDATRAACEAAIDALALTGFAAKREDRGKLHVTLAFLGNVEDSRFEEIAAAMRRAARCSAPLTVTFDKLGAFPHERRPRVVYVGAREQGPAFRALAASLRCEYAGLGFTFKDDAVAHVTIARVRDPRRPLPLIEVAATRLQITALTLFESIFDKVTNTSRYAVSATASLAVEPD
jgi:RNA 2',3'-cyclic 3'-phosphodiesterase